MKSKYSRIFLVVLDSLGVGAMPDAANFGDEGTDTLGHLAQAAGSLEIPHLRSLGLANLHPVPHVPPAEQTKGYRCYLREASNGKDTMTGHWEMMGLKITKPFQVFTDTGFPQELIQQLEQRTGRKVIGNKSASGTEILDELGEEQLKSGALIVYTSADSVLQIAASEETIGLEELYRCCEIARELTLEDRWKVGRVIARPYVGKAKGSFRRTPHRKDYALAPFEPTDLEVLKDSGKAVIGVGKIGDIFSGQGLTESLHSDSSVQGMEQTRELLKKDFSGLCFTNLVDFDALWGHRRNPVGYAKELEKFDVQLGMFLASMGDDDLLMITADHGNDPTHKGTDHTREQVFLLAYSPSMEDTGLLPVQDSFAGIGATILDNFHLSVPQHCIGRSLLAELR